MTNPARDLDPEPSENGTTVPDDGEDTGTADDVRDVLVFDREGFEAVDPADAEMRDAALIAEASGEPADVRAAIESGLRHLRDYGPQRPGPTGPDVADAVAKIMGGSEVQAMRLAGRKALEAGRKYAAQVAETSKLREKYRGERVAELTHEFHENVRELAGSFEHVAARFKAKHLKPSSSSQATEARDRLRDVQNVLTLQTATPEIALAVGREILERGDPDEIRASLPVLKSLPARNPNEWDGPDLITDGDDTTWRERAEELAARMEEAAQDPANRTNQAARAILKLLLTDFHFLVSGILETGELDETLRRMRDGSIQLSGTVDGGSVLKTIFPDGIPE